MEERIVGSDSYTRLQYLVAESVGVEGEGEGRTLRRLSGLRVGRRRSGELLRGVLGDRGGSLGLGTCRPRVVVRGLDRLGTQWTFRGGPGAWCRNRLSRLKSYRQLEEEEEEEEGRTDLSCGRR